MLPRALCSLYTCGQGFDTVKEMIIQLSLLLWIALFPLAVSFRPIPAKSASTKVCNYRTASSLLMTEKDDVSLSTSVLGAVGAVGIGANGITDYSLYVLKSTGCGLPPGPFDLIGAAEGVGYLTVTLLLVWSISKKIRTGSGLPPGPAGLLGASAGLSFLTLLAAIVIAGWNLNEYGFLPFMEASTCTV